jgi:hypothetical protein
VHYRHGRKLREWSARRTQEPFKVPRPQGQHSAGRVWDYRDDVGADGWWKQDLSGIVFGIKSTDDSAFQDCVV